jgi:hypothetical protein
MGKFYFSRNCEPNPFASKYLVSGVIDAGSMEEAKTNLDDVLSGIKSTDRSSTFSFIDLDLAEPSTGGLIAITMGV